MHFEYKYERFDRMDARKIQGQLQLIQMADTKIQ